MPNENHRPNILVLFSDTHGAWATGCYGSDVAVTPNLDKLAAEGTVFDRAYCQNPLCVPSRQSLITGQYSCQSGVLQNDTPMPRLFTMGHHLAQQAGYETAALGKMHFIPDSECSQGGERHHGFAERLDYEEFWRYLRDERGVPPLPDHPDDPWQVVHLEKAQHALQWPKVVASAGAPAPPLGSCATLPHEDHQEALVLRTWQEFLARERRDPFLAFVSFQSPHPPFLPPDEFLEPFQRAMPLPPDPDETMLSHPVWRRRARAVDSAVREEYLRYYYAFVSYTDWCVGQALDMLDTAGLGDRTLVVYVSDHGEMGHHHGLCGKTVFYEPSVRVPLIARLPGVVGADRRYRGLVELLDLFPTFCDVAQVAPPAGLAGRSLWPDLGAGNGAGKEAVYSESYPMERNVDVFGPRPHRMVRTARWKLIQYGDVCVDLFDVETDPDERHDLSADPACRKTVHELLCRLDARLGPLPDEQCWRTNPASA